jgi:LuxR family transcriptional regulator, maltose regulon positive regulatory protein
MEVQMQAIAGTSKITPPRLQRIVERPRLLEMLEREKEKPLVLVLGQAAQGKSTLVASYSERCKRPSAWINLGREESDPVNLFRLVVQSVQHALKDGDLSGLLQYVAMDMGPRAETPLYQGWTRALIGAISSPVQIVLDGLDRLAPQAPSFHLLEVFLHQVGSGIRLILLSRTEPPFDIQNLKMRQEAAVIDNDQLAFTLEETETFFREIHDLSLPSDQVERIHALNEGWVGGLLLFSEALKSRPQRTQQRFLAEESITEFKREAFRYLGDEIFSPLNRDFRDFLVKSSILEVIDPIFVKELLGINDAEAILREMSERNLFVQLLYDQEKGWSFRYHQMFRDFLRTRFELETTREERERLFARAGHVYEQRAEYESALDYYLQAKAYPEASKVLERIGIDLLKSGRMGDLSQRLGMLPEDLIQQNPWLLYYLSMTRRFTAARENTKDLLTCLDLFERKGDVRGQIMSLALLIEAFLLSGRHSIPMEGLITRAETLLENLPQDLYANESAVLLFQVGHGWTLSCGNPRKGFWCCEKAYLIAGHCGDINLQGSAVCSAIEALSWLGEFELADELCLELQELVEASPYPEQQVYYLIALATLSMLRGEIQKAREQISLAQSVVGKHGLLYWHTYALATDLFVTVYEGELERAENIAKHMLDSSSSMGNRGFEGIALFDMAWISYHKEEWHEAKEFIDRSARILSSEESLNLYHYHGAVVIRSLILYHLDEVDEGDEELQKTIDHLGSVSDYLDLVDAHVVMAFRKTSRRENDKAKAHLEEAFRIAEEKGHYHTALLSREDFADACVLALEMNVEGAAEYASHLLSAHLPDLADSRLKDLEMHSSQKAAQRFRELRKEIYLSALPRLRIQCLGKFEVRRGDVPIEDEAWERAQPKSLLKALIARDARQTSREVLMEDLWPESNAQSAERNFKVTLHRLRKTLEPGMDQSFGSSYLHLKDNLLSLDKDLCSVDIEDFFSFAEKGQKGEAEGNFKKALTCYGKAVELYRGDFLAADLYLPWVETKREAFRRTYVDVLTRMASLWERQGKSKKAIECWQRIIQAEPFTEEAYQKTMLLYGKRGMRNAALRVYEEYKKQLKAELDVEPDEATTAIYRKIAEDAK